MGLLGLGLVTPLAKYAFGLALASSMNRQSGTAAFQSHPEGSLWLFDVTTSKKRHVTWIGGLFLSKAR
jgi:hypothetical protein